MLDIYNQPVPCCEAKFSGGGALLLNGLRGHFRWGYSSQNDPGLIIDYRCTDAELHVQADYYGMIPLFYSMDDQQMVVAPTIKQVLDLLSDYALDDAALAFFLRSGYFLGNDTPFKKIRRVPPGATMVANAGGFTIHRPLISKSEPIAGLTKTAAQAHYADLFQSAIKDATETSRIRTCLPLSGGQDSRHILYALAAENRPPDICVTIRSHLPTPDDDAHTARAIASQFGLDHLLLDEPQRRVDAEIEKNTLVDFCVLMHRWALPLNEFTRSSNVDIIYDGIAGDMLSAGRQLTRERLDLFESQHYEELAENIIGSDGYLSKVLKRERSARWSRNLAVMRLSNEIEKFEGRNNPISEFFVENRTRRAIAPSSWKVLSGPGVIPFAPFLNRELFKFLRSLPLGFVVDGDFHENTILERYPYYERIPFSPKNMRKGNLKKKDAARIVASYITSLKPKHTSGLSWPYLTLKLSQALISAPHGTAVSEMLRVPIYLAQLENLRLANTEYLF